MASLRICTLATRARFLSAWIFGKLVDLIRSGCLVPG